MGKSIFAGIDSKTLRELKKKLEENGRYSKCGDWELLICDYPGRDSGKWEAKIKNSKSKEGLSVLFFTFERSFKKVIKIGVDALKAKDKFFKKFKGIEFYFKQALRECNKNNPRVVIPYVSSAVTFKDGKYYYTKLLDLDRCEINLGEGVKNKRDFMGYAGKMIKLAESTGCTGVSFRSNWYSESSGYVMNKFLHG